MTATANPTRPAPLVMQVPTALLVGNRQAFKAQMFALIDTGQRRIVLDFSETGYVDNTGLGVLVSISKRIHDCNGQLALCHLNEDIAKLFEITKLDTLFTIAETVGRALQLLGEP